MVLQRPESTPSGLVHACYRGNCFVFIDYFTREEHMHPVINALTELHYKLEEAHQLLEKVADEYNTLLKENVQLKDKLFWQDDTDDGKC
jgi:hypothetical protein